MNILSILLFSFALLTDTHISTSNPRPMEDLQRSVADIPMKRRKRNFGIQLSCG